MADIVIIFARNTQSNQIEGFILDTHSAGVTIRNVEPKLALRIV